jgi:hypothetical protein
VVGNRSRSARPKRFGEVGLRSGRSPPDTSSTQPAIPFRLCRDENLSHEAHQDELVIAIAAHAHLGVRHFTASRLSRLDRLTRPEQGGTRDARPSSTGGARCGPGSACAHGPGASADRRSRCGDNDRLTCVHLNGRCGGEPVPAYWHDRRTVSPRSCVCPGYYRCQLDQPKSYVPWDGGTACSERGMARILGRACPCRRFRRDHRQGSDRGRGIGTAREVRGRIRGLSRSSATLARPQVSRVREAVRRCVEGVHAAPLPGPIPRPAAM